MNVFRIRAWIATTLALAALACADDDVRRYQVRGVVRDLQRDSAQVIIEHEEIPGLMPAMTMNFDLADAAWLDRLEPGQAIEFTLEVTRRSYRVAAFTLLDGEGGERAPRASLSPLDRPAPPFALVDQRGQALSLADLRGKAVILDFIFTHCPGPCPILTGAHAELRRSLSPEIAERTWLVSITLDPERDTPEVLRQYAKRRGADFPNWSFLTGPLEVVDEVARNYGVGSVRDADGAIDHTVATFLIDPEGRIVRHYLGVEHDSEEIARDLLRALS